MGDLGSGEDGISPIPCGSGRKLGVNVEDHGSSLQTLARLRLRPTRRVSVGVIGRVSRRSEAEPGRAFGTEATAGQAFV